MQQRYYRIDHDKTVAAEFATRLKHQLGGTSLYPRIRAFKKLVLVSLLTCFVASCTALSIPQPRAIISSSLPLQLLWQIQLDEAVAQQPLITEQVIVVLSTKALYGLDSHSGNQLWRQPTVYQRGAFPMVVSDKMVVYGDSAGYTTALALNTGDVVWRYKIGDGNTDFMNSIALDEHLFFALAQPTYVEARKLDTGELIWQLEGSEHNIDTRGAYLFVQSEKLYIVTAQQVHIVNKATGQIEKVVDASVYGAQVVNKRLYDSHAVFDLNTFDLLFALKPSSRKLLYGNCEQFKLPYTISEDFVYGAGYCGGIFAIQPKGEIAWAYHEALDSETPMALFNADLYALFDNGEIHAINPLTGENQGILKTNGPLPGFVANSNFASRGLTTNGSVLIATFNDLSVWAFSSVAK
ncbi:MAG: PQQ-binding-like beta-propeller repeat protein [Caldilineaceae bacterium]